MTFFREILTVIAGLVALLLVAALAVPWFIDWNAHRPVIADMLSKATGSTIKIAGEIDLKLLPSPRLHLSKLTITGRKAGSPRLEADALRMELALTALLSGEVRFVSAELDRLRVFVSMDKTGAVQMPTLPKTRPRQIAFQSVVVRDGTLIVNRSDSARRASELKLQKINLNASVQSLNGPFRGSGRFVIAGRPIEYSFNTSQTDDNGVRLKVVTEASGPVPHGEYDGRLQLVEYAGGKFAAEFKGRAGFKGTAQLSEKQSRAWRIAGPFHLDISGAKLEPAELRAGDDDNQVSATGSVVATFGDVTNGSKKIVSSFAAQQINIDELFGGSGDAGSSMRRFHAVLSKFTKSKGIWLPHGFDLQLDLSTPALTVGGETLTAITFGMSVSNAKPARLRFVTGAPGSSKVSIDGLLETGVAPVFRGKVQFSTLDMRRLEKWLNRGLPNLAHVASALPYRAFDIQGRADISNAGIAARDLKIKTGRSQFDGTIIYTRKVGQDRARLHVDLNSPALDLDGLNDLTAPAGAMGESDLYIAIDARAIRVAQFGKGVIDAGKIALRLKRQNGQTELEKLSVENLGGATFSATGSLSKDTGQTDIDLNADNLVQLASVIQRVAPGPWSKALAARAVSLSPAKLRISVEAGGNTGKDDRLRVSRLSIEGAVRGTKISGSMAPGNDGKIISGRMNFRAGEASMLLRQLGVEVLPVAGLGKGAIDLVWKGGGKGHVEAAAKANFAGTQLNFAGRLRSVLPRPDIQGRIALVAGDATPLLQLLALAAPDLQKKAPLDLSGKFSWRGQRVGFGQIKGKIFNHNILGDLSLAPQTVDKNLTRAHLSGSLRFEQLSLRGLSALVLGQSGRGKPVWAQDRFKTIASWLPIGDLAIRSGVLDLPGGYRGRDAEFDLKLLPGLLAINKLRVKAGNATVRGQLNYRKVKTNGAVAGSLTFDAPLGGVNNIGGYIAGKAEFAGTGQSELAIISSLAGKGALAINNLKIDRADPRALSVVLAASSAERLGVGERSVLSSLAKAFAKDTLTYKMKKFDLSIAGGQVRLDGGVDRNLAGAIDVKLGSTIDLRDLSGVAELRLTARKKPKDWNGSPPTVTKNWNLKKSGGKPVIGASSFVNGLSALAIIREARRAENLAFDIRERSFFNRRAKMREFEARRKVELERFKVVEARRAEEARLKAEEEEKRRAALQKQEEEQLRLEKLERERLEKQAREAERKALEKMRLEEARAKKKLELEAAAKEKKLKEEAVERARAAAKQKAVQQQQTRDALKNEFERIERAQQKKQIQPAPAPAAQ